jgi:hypothetical protein
VANISSLSTPFVSTVHSSVSEITHEDVRSWREDVLKTMTPKRGDRADHRPEHVSHDFSRLGRMVCCARQTFDSDCSKDGRVTTVSIRETDRHTIAMTVTMWILIHIYLASRKHADTPTAQRLPKGCSVDCEVDDRTY